MTDTAQTETGVVHEPPVLARGEHRRSAHPALRFVARRLAAGLLTLFVASMLIYGALLVIPGDVAQIVLGRNATPERLAEVRSQLNLDDSIVSRYLDWLGGMVTGDLGNSMASLAQGQVVPVSDTIGTPLLNSLLLAALTILVFIPICLVLAIIASLRAGRKADQVISASTLAVASLPEFLTGTLLIVVFFSTFDLLPAVSTGERPLENPKDLVLPIITLLAVCTAFGTRLLRASMVEVLREDYVSMARLNGIRERRVVSRYVLRNSLAPAVQALAQVSQYLIGGIIIVESLFNYPGIGKTLVQAVLVRDPQMVSVVAVLLAGIYIIINIAADLVVTFLVPRLRTQL